MSRRAFRLSRFLRDAVTRATRVFDGTCAVMVMLVTFTIVNLGRMPDGFDEFMSARLSVRNIALLILFVLIWHACFALFGLYRTWPSVSIASTTFAAPRIVGACTVATAGLSSFTFASNSGAFSQLVIFWFWVAGVMAELGGRATIAGAARYLERRALQVRVAVIVGSGPRALTLCQSIENREPKETVVLGFVDTRDPREIPPEILPRMIGTLEGLERLLCSQPIDQALITLPIKSCYAAIQQALQTCERIGVEAISFYDIFSSTLARPAYDEDDELPVVHHQFVAADHRLVIKRAIDILGAAGGVIAFAPILIGCAVAVKLSSPGPILFAQQRYGYNRRQFRMYKFRTMVADAEQLQATLESQNEAQGPVFKIKADPRVTRVGRIMRKLSLDELPQLINVLTGDMSLVGPRPLPVRDVARFNEAWLMRRFSVRPGLTCLWQVNGRSETGFDQWVKLDLDYIDNWSLSLDMRILIKTVPVVLSGSGAM